jgi:hypothetical protein
VGEQVEHDEGGGGGGGQVSHSGWAGAQPVLQCGEVQAPGLPHHDLPVQHRTVVAERGEQAATSGNAAVSGRCWRDCSTTAPGAQKASARNPSNFGSNTHPGPTGNARTVAAAIGAIGATTGDRLGLPTAGR